MKSLVKHSGKHGFLDSFFFAETETRAITPVVQVGMAYVMDNLLTSRRMPVVQTSSNPLDIR